MESEIISAIQKGYFQQVRLLVKSGLNANSHDSHHRTPLIYCALINDESWGVGLARTLLEGGARANLTDRAGLGPLHYACILGKALLLRVYLGAADFDVNLADYLGNTALHYAAAMGFVEAVETLLATCERYGYRIDALNRQGSSPMDMAMQNGHGQCASLIQDAKRRLLERVTLMRSVSVPDLALLASDRKRDFSITRRLKMSRNGWESGSNNKENDDGVGGLTFGFGGPTSGGASGKLHRLSFGTSASAASDTSDTSGSSNSSASMSSYPKSSSASSDATTKGWTQQKSWSASSKHDGGAPKARRSSHEMSCSLADDRSTSIYGYEMVIRKLRSLRPINAAPAKDPRSNPAKILGHNPSDIFAFTPGRGGGQLEQTPTSATTIQSWRSAMNGLYDTYYFQFSTTYRPPVKLAATVVIVHDGGEGRRRFLPVPSGAQRPSGFGRTGGVGKFSAGGTHHSTAGNGDHLGLPQPRLRKTSGALAPRPLQRQRRQSQQTSVSGGSSSSDRHQPYL